MINGSRAAAIIAAAGSGRRMGGPDKLYLKLSGVPVLAASLMAFEKNDLIDEIVISVREGMAEKCRNEIIEPYGITKVRTIVTGGSERSLSVKAAVSAVSEDCGIVMIHDGARPLVSQAVINRVADAAVRYGAAIPGIMLKDTVKTVREENGDLFAVNTPVRAMLRAVQTPQGFRREILQDMYFGRYVENEIDIESATDDASIAEMLGHRVCVVEGDINNIKITVPQDLPEAEGIIRSIGFSGEDSFPSVFQNGQIREIPGEAGPMKKNDRVPVFRTGTGYDVHAFAEGRKLILGGVDIPYERGLDGHSDADVLIHAVMDALLGACALGDIGQHFPDTDERYKGISSVKLLKHVAGLLREHGYRIVNIDSIVIAQKPRLAGYIGEMRGNIAEALEIKTECVSVKATTTERLGFTGREEGIAAQAAVSVVSMQEEFLL